MLKIDSDNSQATSPLLQNFELLVPQELCGLCQDIQLLPESSNLSRCLREISIMPSAAFRVGHFLVVRFL